MFTKSARFYDAIYSFKNYEAESEKLRRFIDMYAQRECQTLLDVATGTGAHLIHLRTHFDVAGLDLDETMLEVARQRLPDVTFYQGNMQAFELPLLFDVVTCLFSSIGYLMSIEDLDRTIANFAAHTRDGGLVIVEPWFTPDQFRGGTVHSRFVDEPDLKIARINKSDVVGDIAVMEMHYLVGTPQDGVTHFAETHRMKLFSHEDYRTAFAKAALKTHFDETGLMNRGLYIGVKTKNPSY